MFFLGDRYAGRQNIKETRPLSSTLKSVLKHAAPFPLMLDQELEKGIYPPVIYCWFPGEREKESDPLALNSNPVKLI